MILTYLASLYFVLRYEKRDVSSSWGLFGLVSFALYTALLSTIWNRLQSPFLLILEPFPYLPLRLRLTEGSSRSCVYSICFSFWRDVIVTLDLLSPRGANAFFRHLFPPPRKRLLPKAILDSSVLNTLYGANLPFNTCSKPIKAPKLFEGWWICVFNGCTTSQLSWPQKPSNKLHNKAFHPKTSNWL